MKDIKEFYILGLPIDTDIGQCEFIKVKEYPDYFADLQIMSLNKLHIIYKYHEINKNHEFDDVIKELEKLTLFEIVTGIPEIQMAYYRVFLKVFGNEEALYKINNQNFDYYRKLIMDMNCVKEEVINPNPEIQRFIEKSKRVKQQDSEPLTFADIVSSVVGYNGLSYQDINEMTVYQLYMTFHRIAQIKGYDTAVLFKTVQEKFKENIKVENWCKHINLLEEEKHAIEYNTFKQTTGSIVNE
jgi:hypothetical protein